MRDCSALHQCTHCGEFKPETHFYFSRGYLNQPCRECKSFEARERYVMKKPPDRWCRRCKQRLHVDSFEGDLRVCKACMATVPEKARQRMVVKRRHRPQDDYEKRYRAAIAVQRPRRYYAGIAPKLGRPAIKEIYNAHDILTADAISGKCLRMIESIVRGRRGFTLEHDRILKGEREFTL